MDALVPRGPTSPTLSEGDLFLLRRLRLIIQIFRRLEGRIPSSYMDAFLLVAITPGLGPTEYARGLGTSQPVASRILLELGTHARERDTQLDLVDRRPSALSLARQEYFLTAKGNVVLNQIIKTLKREQP